MRFFAPALVGLGILFGPLVAVVRADLSPEEVRAAIQRGVGYLKGSQKADGTWTDYLGQTGGITCLCTLALLNAGVDPQEEHIQNALKSIRRLRPKTTYVTSLQTMVLCRAEPERDQGQIGGNVAWLEQNQIRSGPRSGAWAYPAGTGDNSNSQFALLALYEAERAAEAGRIRVQVHRDTWERAKAYWTAAQNPNGSWGYYSRLDGTGSMTCAGISSLVIASDVIHQPDARVVGDAIQCCPRSDDQERDRVQDGIEWLRRNYTIESNPGQRGELWHYYFLYGLERACRLTNRRFIGQHDWYREGTAYLLKMQGTDQLSSGCWEGHGHAEDDRNIATSLGLLFLSKGRRPIILAKLKHGASDDWNQRRNDINNLTIYVEGQWKRDLSWQIVGLDEASVDDLLHVPVLYYAGSGSPLPSSPQKQEELAQKLRDYLDRGGFLLAEADCCSAGFDDGFRQLMRLVFPEEEYRLKVLDPSHPIWHAEQQVPPEGVRPLLGIDFGCRTSVVYAPLDGSRPSLSCLWELSRAGRDTKYSEKVQAQIDAARAIGINVLAYATNREVKGGEESFVRPSTSRSDKVERGRLDIAKLKHAGGCDAAPLALANLMEVAGRELKGSRVNPHPVLLDIRDDAIFDYPVVFMHGRNTFRLTDEERTRLRTILERGGLLFADAICSSPAFIESFRRELSEILPKNALERIAANDPLWTPKFGGFDLSTVMRRDPQPGGSNGPLRAVLRKVPPELDGVKLDGHYAVIFSPYDISCALEKHDSLQCRGYTREDAARIALNVLLYATQP